MKSSFHSLIPFLPSLLNHSTAISRGSQFSWQQLTPLLSGSYPAGLASRHSTDSNEKSKVKVKVMLRPTVSRPICLGIKHPSGAYDQIFITVRQLRVSWYGEPALTRGRACLLQCTIYNIFTFYMLLPECIYNIYKAFVSWLKRSPLSFL
jgi:hypothetical protein